MRLHKRHVRLSFPVGGRDAEEKPGRGEGKGGGGGILDMLHLQR